MNDFERLRQWRQSTFLAYRDWLNSYHWHWFVTFTLRDYDNQLRAETLLHNWIEQLSQEENLEIAYVYIYCEKYKHAHLHVLMYGRNVSGDKTLLDVSRSKWERRWPCIAGIQIPRSNYYVSRVLSIALV